MKNNWLLTSSIVALLSISSNAQAQDNDNSANPATSNQEIDGGIRDIVVYGERRATGSAVQRVPIAITAIDSDALEETNSVDIADIGALSPSVQTSPVGTFPGFPNFSIRGIGVNSSIRSVDPAINIIQDGLVIAYQAGAIVSTFDLESVEILRGPQGVLFGRNATGGAIVLRTRRPDDHFGLRGDFSYGNFNDINANISVEGPLGSPNILGKLAVQYHSNTGTIKNTNKGIFVPAPANPSGASSSHPTGHVGDADELIIKPTFSFKLGDGHDLTVFGQYQRFRNDGIIARNFQPAGLQTTLVTSEFGYTPTTSGYETNIGDPGYLDLDAGHVIMEFENEIGPGKLTSTLGYRHVSYDSTNSLFGSPFPLFFFRDNTEENDQYSFESRYNVSLNDSIELLVGVFYLNSQIDVLEQRQFSAGAGNGNSLNYVRGSFDHTTNAYAAFANVDWAVTDRLKLSIGGRYSHEKKSITYVPLAGCAGPGFTNCPQVVLNTSKNWNDFSPRLVATYTPADRILLYASYTAGFRSGNYNPRTTDTTGIGVGPADPENVNSYEIGAKTDLFDRKVRLNISAYQSDYKDIQQVLTAPGTGVVQTLLNAANARIRGVESELTVKPVNILTLNANVGYTDGKFRRFNVPVGGVADPTKLTIAKIPEWTVYLASTVTVPIDSMDADLSMRVSYDWRSRFETDLPNTPGLAQPAYGLIGANVTFSKDNWSIGAFGRNLGNTHYAETYARGFSWVYLGGAPRTYGVRFTYEM